MRPVNIKSNAHLLTRDYLIVFEWIVPGVEEDNTAVSEGIISLSLSGVYLEWRKRIQTLHS